MYMSVYTKELARHIIQSGGEHEGLHLRDNNSRTTSRADGVRVHLMSRNPSFSFPNSILRDLIQRVLSEGSSSTLLPGSYFLLYAQRGRLCKVIAG